MATEIKMPAAPPDWVNGLIGLMLRTPLVQRLVGRTFALMTVTGAKTGRRYTIPVQYLTRDGEFVVGSLRTRRWWRNFRTRPEVEIRIAGVWINGLARIASDDEERSLLTDLLATEPQFAKFYGLQPDESGMVPHEEVERLLEHVVHIFITPNPIDAQLEPGDAEHLQRSRPGGRGAGVSGC